MSRGIIFGLVGPANFQKLMVPLCSLKTLKHFTSIIVGSQCWLDQNTSTCIIFFPFKIWFYRLDCTKVRIVSWPLEENLLNILAGFLGFRFPIYDPRSYLKYLVCNKEATYDNTNGKESIFIKNSST